MSFFEIEPMGAGMRKMRGGVAMGGVSLGGVSLGGVRHRAMPSQRGGVMMGGAEGSVLDKIGKDVRTARLSAIAKQIKHEEDMAGRKISMPLAKAMARLELMKEDAQNKALLKEEAKASKPSAMALARVAKQPKETKKALRKRLMTLKKQQEGEIQYFRDELAPKGLTQAQLRDIATQLADYGVGLYDMESGCGFFGDLWDGVKSVGKTALQVAPHLLPLML